jgi:hypothetical protein
VPLKGLRVEYQDRTNGRALRVTEEAKLRLGAHTMKRRHGTFLMILICQKKIMLRDQPLPSRSNELATIKSTDPSTHLTALACGDCRTRHIVMVCRQKFPDCWRSTGSCALRCLFGTCGDPWTTLDPCRQKSEGARSDMERSRSTRSVWHT